MKHDIHRGLHTGRLSDRAIEKIAGQCTSMAKAILPANCKTWQDFLKLTQCATDDIHWGLDSVSSWKGVVFINKSTDVHIKCDASSKGFGRMILVTNVENEGPHDMGHGHHTVI